MSAICQPSISGESSSRGVSFGPALNSSLLRAGTSCDCAGITSSVARLRLNGGAAVIVGQRFQSCRQIVAITHQQYTFMIFALLIEHIHM